MNSPRKLFPSMLLMAGLGAVFAGPAVAEPGCPGMGGREMHQERHAKRMELHHKQLHDALKLSAEQESGWKKLIDSEPHKPAAGLAPPEDWSKLSTPDRAEKMLEFSKQHQVQMGEHVVALKAFYATLTAEQQKTFDDSHRGPKGGMGRKSGMRPPMADKAPVTKP